MQHVSVETRQWSELNTRRHRLQAMSNFITKYLTPSVSFKVKHSFLWSAVYEIKISTNVKKENKHNNLDYSWTQQIKQIPANNLLQFSI